MSVMSKEKITDEEQEIIRQFRSRIEHALKDEERDDEHFIMKWLIARKYDIDKAEAMFKKHIRFMKLNGLDKIDDDFKIPEAALYFHTAKLGYDKDGSVVRLIHVGASDLPGLVYSLSKMDSFKAAVYFLESDSRQQKRDRANDSICRKQTYIFDLNGLGWRSILHRAVAERAFSLLKNYEENFPESLKVVFVVNAPSFFSIVYNWLKTFLPESILQKVNIVSAGNCKAVLTELIDPALLPPAMGGTLKDETGDPNCPSLYVKPLYAPIPEELKLYNQAKPLDTDPDAKRVEVDCGLSFRIETVITVPHSVLQWDFQTEGYDISLGLNFRPDKDTPFNVVMPPHRVESHRFPESGNLTCHEPGIYEIVFDNSYSWFTRKQLIYKVNVKLPDQRRNSTSSLEEDA